MKLFKKEHVKHEPAKRPVPATPDEFCFEGIDFEVHGLVNFTAREEAKILEAMKLGKLVLNSLEFKERLLAADMTETNGLTNQQIYDLLCSGKDLYNEVNDHDIDLFLTMYHNFWTGTIGYTYPNTFKTWINRKFFSRFDVWEIFGNVVHEAFHNFGFDHITTFHSSVPYTIGFIARDLLKEMVEEGRQLTPIKWGEEDDEVC